MSSLEFTEWMAYYRIEPFGPWRSDYQAGIVAAAVVNARAFRPKHEKPHGPAEFMPSFEPKKAQSTTEQKEIMRLWAQLRPPPQT